MNALTDQIAVVVARHSPVTGLGYSRTRCGCGEVFTAPYVKSHATHVAERIAEALLQETQPLLEAASSALAIKCGCCTDDECGLYEDLTIRDRSSSKAQKRIIGGMP